MSAELVLDPARCKGHGICCLMAPGIVELDDWGYAQVALGGPLQGEDLRRARRAARACPAAALRIEGDGDPGART